MKKKEQLIKKLDFGFVDAEHDNLSDFFYSTPVFEQIIQGKIDLILGYKGAGKSALFKAMVDFQGFHKGIEEKYILPINSPSSFIHVGKIEENLFSQVQFWEMWKIYFCILIGKFLIESSTLTADISYLKKLFTISGLSDEITHKKTISQWFTKIIHSAYMSVIISGIEYRTGLIASQADERKKYTLNIDEILNIENDILKNNSRELWILVDKLDEILPGAIDNFELRDKALQALMNAQSELSIYKNIKIKLFLRTDIYNNLSFVNKDHYSDRKLEITWDADHLQILLGIRIAAALGKYDPIKSGQYTISQKEAEENFDLVFDPVTINDRNFKTILWIFDILKDGKDFVSPRDIILLSKESLSFQQDFFHRKINYPKTALISQEAIFNGFHKVSNDKLYDYLYGIFPHIRRTFELFRGIGIERRSLKIKEVSELMGNPDTPTLLLKLDELCQLGALEKLGNKSIERTEEFIIPQIYATALNQK